jgi:ribosome-associated heat shock protein Hsp15
MDKPVRLDKWLWAARFFKTRGQAREAIKGGKVQLNGNRVKPGRIVQPGDRLRIQRGAVVFIVTVAAVSNRRGPAAEACQLWSEDEGDRRRREEAAEQRARERAARATRARRPDKRERRRIIRFRRGPD